MTSRSSSNNNRRTILIGLSVVFLLLLVGVGVLLYLLFGRGESAEEVDIVVEGPTPTFTHTPIPSLTPTHTATPLPTSTPTPLPTATPSPMRLSITGPKFIPRGLPIPVEYTITALDGGGVAIVSLEDLGSSMVVGDAAGNVIIAQTVSSDKTADGLIEYEESFTVSAIIDTNINRGVASFLIDNNFVSEPVLIPWLTTDTDEVEYATFTVVLDGVEDENPIETSIDESQDQVALNEGFATYQSRNNLTFEYPDSWYLSETQDDTVQISAAPLDSATGASAVDTSYALIVSGTREETGIPEEVDFTNVGIKDWLLGDLGNVGGEDVPILSESGLEIVSEFEIPLNDGTVATAIELKSEGSNEQSPFNALYVINTVEDKTFIMTAYALVDSDDTEIFNQIAETISFGG